MNKNNLTINLENILKLPIGEDMCNSFPAVLSIGTKPLFPISEIKGNGDTVVDLINSEYEARIKELEKENNELKSSKRFGLVWEDKPDGQVNRLHTEIPMLIEDTDKAVVTNENDVNHILINGDNFHALTVLRTSHLGKVDVIYIDPPYNTGNKDFVYNDNYIDKEDGYYHSKWLSFMEKRLILAKELLSDTGVIFVSIDDREQARLKLLMDQVFSPENFIASIIWKKTENIKMDSKFLSGNKEYILCYKNSGLKYFNKDISTDERFKLEDNKGKYYLRKMDSKSHTYTKGLDYVIEHEGVKYYAGGSKEKYEERQSGGASRNDARWLWSKRKFEDGLLNDEIVFRNGNVYNKVRFDGINKKPFIDIFDFVSGQTGQKDFDSIFSQRLFDHPKPHLLIQRIVKLHPNPNAIVLDFFAGSGTTAHAVAELNKEDGGSRQCILVTDGGKTETVGQSAKNAKNTTVNIAEEITYERVKRVLTGQNWADGKEHEPLGGNLRYFKIEMENVEGLTADDQKGLFQHHLINHAMIAENTFIKVLSKQDDLDSLYPKAYNVLTNSDNSKYLVVIEAHDHKLKELKAFLDTIDDNKEVILIGERIDKINWVKNNKGEYRIDTLLDKMIENRLSILNSSVFN